MNVVLGILLAIAIVVIIVLLLIILGNVADMRNKLLGTVKRGFKKMSDTTARLTQSVEALTTENDSIQALVETLAAEIRENAGDEEALNALADRIDAERAEIAATVLKNTPADPGTGGGETGSSTDEAGSSTDQ